MAHEVVMPQLGLSMDRGRILRWLKQSGEMVHQGEILLEVESDKATAEVEAVQSGRLYIIQQPTAEEITVGKVIAYLLAEGEQAPAETVHTVSSSSANSSSHPVTQYGRHRPRSSPAARRKARELGIDWTTVMGTGPKGRIKERDVLGLVNSTPSTPPARKAADVTISPVARRMAEAVGLDIKDLALRFPGRRIEQADVERAIRSALGETARTARSALASRTTHREPMSNLRRLIADHMVRSAHTAAPVTLATEADATELVRIREAFQSEPLAKILPSYNALFAKLVSIALVEFPIMNSSLDGDEIIFWERVHIGIAVETERGLVVPVIHDVDLKPLRALVVEVDELLARAAQGKALPDELASGTFTITNLGVFDIDMFTPIINEPQCAILGVGRLVRKVVPINDQVATRTMVNLSLTFDHRLVDGAPAARFMKRVKQFIEQPYLWLI